MTQVALALPKSDVPDSLAEMMQVARFLSDAGDMMPRHLRGAPSALLAVMMKARALNIPMSMAFEHIILIEGKPGMSAVLMQALVNRAGYSLYPVEELCDATRAVVQAVRPGISATGDALVSFDIEEAKRAGLFKVNDSGEIRARSFKKPDQPMPWEAWTPDMLVARALSRAARRYFPDVLLGMVYTPDELGAEVDEEGKPVKVDSIRVDLPEEVKKYILLINACSTLPELRKLYEEIKEAGMAGELTMDGLTLTQAVTRQKKHLEQTGAPAAADTGPAPAAEPEQQQAEPEGSTPVVSEPAAENPETDFDQLDTTTVATEGEPPVADDDTDDTPRRRGVLKLAAELFLDADTAESRIVEHFRQPLDTVGTPRLQQWLAQVRKNCL